MSLGRKNCQRFVIIAAVRECSSIAASNTSLELIFHIDLRRIIRFIEKDCPGNNSVLIK